MLLLEVIKPLDCDAVFNWLWLNTRCVHIHIHVLAWWFNDYQNNGQILDTEEQRWLKDEKPRNDERWKTYLQTVAWLLVSRSWFLHVINFLCISYLICKINLLSLFSLIRLFPCFHAFICHQSCSGIDSFRNINMSHTVWKLMHQENLDVLVSKYCTSISGGFKIIQIPE